MKTALVLLRTPLQAWLAQDALRQERVGAYDLLYFTQSDSQEDRHYYEILARMGRRTLYCHITPQHFDVMAYAQLAWRARTWMRNHGLDLVILSSMDDYVFSAIASRQVRSEIVTMDDGTANWLKSGSYHRERINWRGRVYRRLLGGYGLAELKTRIVRHYTCSPGFDNIVPRNKVRTIQSPFPCAEPEQESIATFFIGQPFEEVLTATQIARMLGYVRARTVDFYVKHPRESRPLEIGAPVLDKGGLIAEDAILRAAGGRRIQLIGGFSSVFFHIGDCVERKTMILFEESSNDGEKACLAKEIGCEVVFL